MNYLSVCSGIEAATTAWHGLGWNPVAFSEIEPFPSAVLAHHWPHVPNLGDMTKFKEWKLERPIQLLVGGTPCQSFSVAGLRKGLADPRGNLMLTYGAIADHFKPTWIVWENVPGVLSSHGGRDFGTFLGMLGQLGYGFAYRICDAQYHGVAQRRRRVFVVGYLGDWRPAAQVLFESESLRWDPAPSRKAGEGIAQTVTNGPPFSRTGNERVEADAMIVMATGQAGAEITTDHAPCLNCNHEAPILAHTLRGNGFDASEDGTGRGTPLVPVYPINTQIITRSNQLGEGTGFGMGEPTDPAFTLQAGHSHGIMTQSAVRRLTPRECERLQGFPDDHTLIPWKGKPADQCPDGPRYKACGNSMAVPVMRWIGERIQEAQA